MVRGAAGRGARVGRRTIRIDRGIERADALERFAETVLDDTVLRGEAGGLPEKRERRRGIAAPLEVDRAIVELTRARRRLRGERLRRHHEGGRRQRRRIHLDSRRHRRGYFASR
jgi:hypothetical protein